MGELGSVSTMPIFGPCIWRVGAVICRRAVLGAGLGVREGLASDALADAVADVGGSWFRDRPTPRLEGPASLRSGSRERRSRMGGGPSIRFGREACVMVALRDAREVGSGRAGECR